VDIPIDHEAFSGRGLTLRTAGLFKGPRVLIDGLEARGKRKKFALRDNAGQIREVRIKSNHVDPIPKIEIDGQTLELARPLKWYEYAWMSVPILLALYGGALGALFGFGAVYSSARVFRGQRSTAAKYLLSAVISIVATAAFVVLALLVQALMGTSPGA
jgi:hypothetical protein